MIAGDSEPSSLPITLLEILSIWMEAHGSLSTDQQVEFLLRSELDLMALYSPEEVTAALKCFNKLDAALSTLRGHRDPFAAGGTTAREQERRSRRQRQRAAKLVYKSRSDALHAVSPPAREEWSRNLRRKAKRALPRRDHHGLPVCRREPGSRCRRCWGRGILDAHGNDRDLTYYAGGKCFCCDGVGHHR